MSTCIPSVHVPICNHCDRGSVAPGFTRHISPPTLASVSAITRPAWILAKVRYFPICWLIDQFLTCKSRYYPGVFPRSGSIKHACASWRARIWFFCCVLSMLIDLHLSCLLIVICRCLLECLFGVHVWPGFLGQHLQVATYLDISVQNTSIRYQWTTGSGRQALSC